MNACTGRCRELVAERGGRKQLSVGYPIDRRRQQQNYSDYSIYILPTAFTSDILRG